MVRDISAARARFLSGVKPVGPQADDPGILEHEADARAKRELTERLREARLTREGGSGAAKESGM